MPLYTTHGQKMGGKVGAISRMALKGCEYKGKMVFLRTSWPPTDGWVTEMAWKELHSRVDGTGGIWCLSVVNKALVRLV